MPTLNENAEIEEVVQPPVEGAENEDPAQPLEDDSSGMTAEKLANMTSEDFQSYLYKLLDQPSYGASEDDAPESAPPDDTAGEDAPSDEGSAPSAGQGASGDTEVPDEAKPYKTYATEADYKADVQKQIDSAFGQRFARDRERNEKIDRFERAARTFYGDNVDALDAATEDMEAQAARKRNQSPEELRSDLELRRDAERYREEQQQRSNIAAEKQRIVETWQRDAQELKNIDPSFDLVTALKDRTFYNNISNGRSVFQAYSAMKSAEKPPQAAAPKRRAIMQNARETRTGTGGSTVNPARMKTEDFMNYIDRIKNS